MITAAIGARLDKWAGSFDWREALADGEVTAEELLMQLADLEQRYPSVEEEGED